MKKKTNKPSRKINYISASRINQFLKCKKQFYENVIVDCQDQYNGEEEIKDKLALSFGSAVHKTLELFWKNGCRKKSELFRLYREQYVEFGVADPEYHTCGLQIMETYWHNLKYNTPKRVLVAVEQFFSYVLGQDKHGRDIIAQGTIDAIWYLGNGLYEIEDYKTSKWMPTQDDVNANIQIAFYDIAFRSNPQFWYKGIEPKAVILSMNYLRYEDGKIQTEVDDEDRELYKLFFIDTYNQMRYMNSKLFLSNINIFCPNCDFTDRCPAYQEVISDDYEPEDFIFDDENFSENIRMMEHLNAVGKIISDTVGCLKQECIDYMKENDSDVIVGDQKYFLTNYTSRWLLPTVTKKILEKYGLWNDRDFVNTPVGKVEDITRNNPKAWAEIEEKALKTRVGNLMLKHTTVKQTELFSTSKMVKNKK